jgi:hypothetical protein
MNKYNNNNNFLKAFTIAPKNVSGNELLWLQYGFLITCNNFYINKKTNIRQKQMAYQITNILSAT